MTETKDPQTQPQDQDQPNPEATNAGPTSEAPAPDAASVEDIFGDPEVRIAELEDEVASLKDRLLRAMAETENVRRRAERDREDASKYAIANFARGMVVVADNLRRALGSVDATARETDANLETLCVGVEMTEREMLSAFERVGIRSIQAEGQRFDHNYHEAMFELEDPSKPAGTVVAVIETGYVLGDRLLRPARVGVSRGGPKEAPEATKPETSSSKGRAQAYEQTAGGKGTTLNEEL